MKNKIKRGWMIALLFCLTLNTVKAQDDKTETSKMTAEQRADKRTEAVKKKIVAERCTNQASRGSIFKAGSGS